MKSRMNDGENIADYFAEEDFAADEFDAEFERLEREEAEEADRAIDDDATGDYE